MPERHLAGLELVGNALCLDFANTVNSRRVTEHDYLATDHDLLLWAVHAGALPDVAHGAPTPVERAWALRDAVHGVFSAVAARRRPPRTELATIGSAHAHATAAAVLVATGGAFALHWPRPVDPLWPVGRSAGELLLHGDLARVGECPRCGWLFLDTSRNGSRRWCSMATCGSRDKMARYHHRVTS